MISWLWCLNEQRTNCWKDISAHFNCPFSVSVSITSFIFFTMIVHSTILLIIANKVSYLSIQKLIGLLKVFSTCFIRKNSLIPREVIGTVAGTTEIGCTLLCNNTINVWIPLPSKIPRSSVWSNTSKYRKNAVYLFGQRGVFWLFRLSIVLFQSAEGSACGAVVSSLVKTLTGCPGLLKCLF